MDGRFIDELSRRLADALPTGVRAMRDDLEKNFRAVLQANLRKMDLVTREEFEAQGAVLARTRTRLEELEQQVARLEQEKRS